jgi:1-acyl-sn-glycerol-3-phosphate acyltransferase
LRDARNVVWIFPQGVLVPQWLPITVKPGALWLARRSGAAVLPIVFRYEWLVESRPSIFVNLGSPLERGATDEDLRAAMQGLYDSTGSSLAPLDLSTYRPLFKPRMSMNKRWELLTWAGKKEPFNPRNE